MNDWSTIRQAPLHCDNCLLQYFVDFLTYNLSDKVENSQWISAWYLHQSPSSLACWCPEV